MQANPTLLLYIAYLLVNKVNQIKPHINDEEYSSEMLKPDSARFLAFKEYLNIIEIMHMIILQIRTDLEIQKSFNEL